jgi:HK97 family phage portal protein
MSIIDNLLKRMGYEKYQADMRVPVIYGRTAEASQFQIPSGSLSQTQSELYQRISWVNIAVSNVAKRASTVKFEVKKLEGEKTTQIDNHPFEQLLRKPNPLQSCFEFFEATYAYRKLTGNAYWWLNKSTPTAQPAEMWILPPNKIKPVPDKNMFIKGYMYDPGDGTEMPLEPWEVMHFKEFHPNNPFVGLSPVESIAAQAVGDMKAAEYNAQFFEGGARMPNVLAFADPIADDEWEKLKREAKEKGNKRETMFLRNTGAGAVQYIQSGITQKDMEFLQGRQFTKEEIFALFAPGLASILAINATEANAKTGENTLMSLAIYPMQVSMAEKITAEILPLYGDNLVGEFEDVRAKDRELELKELTEFSKTHTIDEVRQEFYNDDPIGDERGNLLLVEVSATPTIDLSMPEEPTDEFQQDIKSYKRKAINCISKNKPLDFDFESANIDRAQLMRIKRKLLRCKTKEDINVVFDDEKDDRKQAGLEDLIAELSNLSEKMITI